MCCRCVDELHVTLHGFNFSNLGHGNASSYVHTTINLKTSGKEEEEDSEKMSMSCLVLTRVMKPLSFLKMCMTKYLYGVYNNMNDNNALYMFLNYQTTEKV